MHQRLRHGLLIGLTTVLAVVIGGPPCGADEPDGQPAGRPPSLVSQIGTPARADAVGTFVSEALQAEPARAREIAAALGRCGGIEAALGLERLVRSRDHDVRVEALRALPRVGIRTQSVLKSLRHAARGFEVRERILAIEALGRLGDGRDVPVLLDLADEKGIEPALRVATYKTLQALSGRRIPYKIQRWDHWWGGAAQADEQRVERAMTELARGSDAESADAHLSVVLAHGWLRLEQVESDLGPWFQSADHALWRYAARVVAHYRLGDLQSSLETALRHVGDDDATATSIRNALRALGVVTADDAPVK